MYVIPVVLILLFIVIAVKGGYDKIELFMLALFMVVIGFAGMNYFFGVNVSALIKDITNPSVDMTIKNNIGVNPGGSQVFHVPGQYDYQNAKALCKAYGGSIATFDQMKEAHRRGAEWCDYGWSDDKMSLYPTQYKTWQAYKEKGDTPCGRPGINGGYNNNLLQKLGANCFASKPAQTGEIAPPSIPQSEVDQRVQYWAGQLPTIEVSPFNYTTWSE